MRISTLLLAASLGALVASSALAQPKDQSAAGQPGAKPSTTGGQGAAAQSTESKDPIDVALKWYHKPMAVTDVERRRRHAATQAALEAAKTAAFQLGAAKCDGPGADYDAAHKAYYAAYFKAQDAAIDESALDPDYLEATYALHVADDKYLHAVHITHSATDPRVTQAAAAAKLAMDRRNAAGNKAYEAIKQEFEDAGVLQPYDPCWRPKVASATPAPDKPAEPAEPPTDGKIDAPVLPKAEVFNGSSKPAESGGGSGSGGDTHGSLFWSGQSPSAVAGELTVRHRATLAAYAGAHSGLAAVNAIGCGGPADSLDGAISDYDAALAHAHDAVASEAVLDRSVLAAARAHGDVDGAYNAAVSRIAAARGPLPDPGGLCPSSHVASELPPPPPPIGGQGQNGPVIVDGMREPSREPTTRIGTELPNPVAHHGGCATGGYPAPPPPPPVP